MVVVVVRGGRHPPINITVSISIGPGKGSSRADSPPANRLLVYGGVAFSVQAATANARQCEFLCGSFETLLIRLCSY